MLYISLFSCLILTAPRGGPQSQRDPADAVKVTRPRARTAGEHGQRLLELLPRLRDLPPPTPAPQPVPTFFTPSDVHTQRWVWQKRTSWPEKKFSSSKTKTSGGFYLISKLLLLAARG